MITGIGVISPIGIGKNRFWENLRRADSNFGPVTLFDTTGLKVNTAGQVSNFNAKDILVDVNLRDLDRASILLSCAVKLAIDDAGLKINENNTKETGIVTGTTFGSLYSISEFDKEAVRDGPEYVNPSVFPSTVGNSPSSRASIIFNVKGLNSTVSTGMCAALDAVEYSAESLHFKRAKTIITGSVEVLSPQIFLGFYKLNYLAGLKPDSELVSCPFDIRRNGIILSEGSAAYILESNDSAKERKAKIYAEILGIGSSFDTARFYNYNPKGTGMKEAMSLALCDAGLAAQDIDCIFANANSTIDADFIETEAIKEVFGEHAYKIPVTAVKSIIGEGYSVSGGMAIVSAIGALTQGFIPATKNLEKPDPRCDLDYVADKPRSKKLSKIMINTFAPNGANTTLIIGRADEN